MAVALKPAIHPAPAGAQAPMASAISNAASKFAAPPLAIGDFKT
jgi:hypothetical protein